jgi:small subunit ribosomal protein S2
MSDISLQQLLEAGCHFGHKSERRNPKASGYIYTEKDGIHIIDLAQTKAGLDEACAFVKDLVSQGGDVLFVGTKRQAKDIITAECSRVGAPYIVERWIGGFLTNWEGIQKTIRKIISMTESQATGGWKKFPKHEQVKMSHHLKRLNMFYGGVVKLTSPPKALFIVDIKKENVAFREAIRCEMPMVAMVDTNVNPFDIAYKIPSNDDAVGSIAIITKALADAYEEGRQIFEKGEMERKVEAEKQAQKEAAKKDKPVIAASEKSEEPKDKPVAASAKSSGELKAATAKSSGEPMEKPKAVKKTGKK